MYYKYKTLIIEYSILTLYMCLQTHLNTIMEWEKTMHSITMYHECIKGILFITYCEFHFPKVQYDIHLLTINIRKKKKLIHSCLMACTLYLYIFQTFQMHVHDQNLSSRPSCHLVSDCGSIWCIYCDLPGDYIP